MNRLLSILILPLMSSLATSAIAASPVTETAVIGGGCFWCVEAQYKLVDGVKKVVSGYAGGHVENPTYEQVCEKTTGHAEVVRIEFDPAKISFRKIIDLFWDAHDPTTPNQQGADKGPQYRSIILYASEEQKKTAEQSKADAQKNFPNPIVTEIVPLKKFYPAEDYHQDFAKNNPYQGYVRVVVTPKVEKFKKHLEKEAPKKGDEEKK